MDGPRQLEGQGTGQGRRHDDCRTTGRPGGVPGQSEARRGMRLTSRRGGAFGERRNPKGSALAVAVMPPSQSRRTCGTRRRRGDASAAGGVPTRAASGTGRAGEGRCFNRAALTTAGRVGCTGAGQGGRLGGLCLFNVTVIVKLDAAFWGNVPQATGGAVVVNLA